MPSARSAARFTARAALGGLHAFGGVRLDLDADCCIVFDRLLNDSGGPRYTPVRSVGVVPGSSPWGMDALVAFDIAPGMVLSQSAAISRFRYRGDLHANGAAVPLAGRLRPGCPGLSFVPRLTARRGPFEGGSRA